MFSFVARWARRWPGALFLLGLVACVPADNWRSLRWPEGRIAAEFPCKPDQAEFGAARMARCESAGRQFVLAWQTLPTPSHAHDAIKSVVPRFSQETRAAPRRLEGALPDGALAWPEAGRYGWRGSVQTAHVMTWTRGLTAYQATVVSTAKDGDVAGDVATRFFNGIRSLP